MAVDGTDNAQAVSDPHLDCYAILGVSPDAEELVIREAFESLTQRYDPQHFAGSEDEAHQKLSDLASAYAIVSDPVRRRRYDLRRRIDALIAPLTAHDAPRQKGSPLAAVDHSNVKLGPRRYHVVLPAVLGTLIVVAIATAYQYLGQPETKREGSSPAAAPPVAAETKPAAITQPMPQPTPQSTPQPMPQSTPQPTAPRAEIPAQPSDAGASGVVTTPAPPQAATTLEPETSPQPPKPAVAKNPPANRTGDAAPAAIASESCSDVAAVLGLCKRKSIVKDK